MSLAITLIVSALLALAIAKPLKRVPVLFYLVAIAICAAGIYLTWYPSPNTILNTLIFSIQKGHLGFSFFTVVMFVGVFAKDSRIRRFLNPVRRELSILSALLIVGHLTPYLLSYLAMSFNLIKYPIGIIISILTALILLILLLVLTATSLNMIRRHIESSRWITIQKLAYIFYVLIFVHMFGFMIGPLQNGSDYALVNLILYTVIFILYLIARLRRAYIDSKEGAHGADLA
jgi:DMSO/TMAO reductase YedYZ heme-binding membrane subunit